MGHLVSARAFRLGVSVEWVDVWFSRFLRSYIMILFSCFRLRFYLLSYFYSKKRDKTGVVYSHLDIIRQKRSLILQIYFYDAFFQKSFLSIAAKLKRISRAYYSFNVRRGGINTNSLGLIFDADFNRKSDRLKWLNNYLFFKKDLLTDTSKKVILSTNDFIKTKYITNLTMDLFNSLVYKNTLSALETYNKKKFFEGREFSLRPLLESNHTEGHRFLNRRSYWLSPVFFKQMKHFKKYIAKKNSYSPFLRNEDKEASFLSFISYWSSFSVFKLPYINWEYVSQCLIDLGANNKKIILFSSRGKTKKIDLANLLGYLRSGKIKRLGDLTGKYRDFVGFLLYRSKRGRANKTHLIRSYYNYFNCFLLKYFTWYHPFLEVWKGMGFDNTPKTLSFPKPQAKFEKFSNWKTDQLSNQNKNMNSNNNFNDKNQNKNMKWNNNFNDKNQNKNMKSNNNFNDKNQNQNKNMKWNNNFNDKNKNMKQNNSSDDKNLKKSNFTKSQNAKRSNFKNNNLRDS